jgi:hypothetical protein
VLSKLEEIKNKPIDDKQSYNSVQVQSNRFKGIFCEKRYGSEIWYKDGVRHRDDDLPAIIQSNGTKKWYKNGKQHRDNDLPAVIEKNGTKRWYKDGKQHRDNGPAIIFAKGVEHWFKNGVKIEPITQDINLISKEN